MPVADETGSTASTEPHPLAPRAKMDLQQALDKKREATLAALTAARDAGGDAQLVETLQQRLRLLRQQSKAVGGTARIHLHAQQLEREQEVRRLRVESHAQATREKAWKLTLQLRQAEAEIARAKGRE